MSSTPPSEATVSGPRRVHLSLTHIDPWSVMKVSFLLSVAMGIMTVVAASFIWFLLDSCRSSPRSRTL